MQPGAAKLLQSTPATGVSVFVDGGAITGPRYLTNMNEEMLVIIRDEAAKKAHPDRHAKLEAFRKAAEVADRAVEGVIRYVEQETGGSNAAMQ